MVSYTLIIVLPVFVLGYYIYKQSDNYIYNRFTVICESVADQSVADVDKKFGEYEYLMRIVQADSVIKNLLEPGYYNDYEKVDAINGYTGSVFSNITSINRAIKKMRIFFTMGQLPEVAGYFYDYSRVSSDDWYMSCLKELEIGNIGWLILGHSLSYDIDPASGTSNDVVSGVIKINDRLYNKVVGLLEIQIDKREVIDSLEIGKEGATKPGLAIFTSDAIEIYDLFPTYIVGSRATDKATADPMILKNPTYKTANEYVQQLKSQYGIQYYFTTRKLSKLGCTIIYSFPLQNIESKGFASRNIIFAVLLSGAVILILISWLLMRLVFSKFKKLLSAVKRIQKGDFETKLENYNQDEVGELAYNINIMTDRVKELINTNVSAKTAQKEAQIKALQAQINPHFMYNTLEAIKMMAEVRDEFAISDVISSLGSILRYNTSSDGGDFVSLHVEISYIRNYISILKLLYDKVNFEIDIDQELVSKLGQISCFRLIIQPLVENSVEHGLKGLTSGGFVKVNVVMQQEDILISVSDNGRGIQPERLAYIRKMLAGDIPQRDPDQSVPVRMGIGILNVHERLVLTYGDGYGINIDSEEMVHTNVSIIFPAIPVNK